MKQTERGQPVRCGNPKGIVSSQQRRRRSRRGSTGNLPVPRGYQPRGTEVRVEKFRALLPKVAALPVRRASGPTAQAGSLCYPPLTAH